MINFSIHSLNSHLFNVFVNQKHIYKRIGIGIGIGRYLSSGIGIVSAGKKWYRGIPNLLHYVCMCCLHRDCSSETNQNLKMITLMLSKYGPLMVILVFGHSYNNNMTLLSAIQTVKI